MIALIVIGIYILFVWGCWKIASFVASSSVVGWCKRVFVFVILLGIPFYIYKYEEYQFYSGCENTDFYPRKKISAPTSVFYNGVLFPENVEALKNIGVVNLYYEHDSIIKFPSELLNPKLNIRKKLSSEKHEVISVGSLSSSIEVGVFKEYESQGNIRVFSNYIYDYRLKKIISKSSLRIFRRYPDKSILVYLLPYEFDGCLDENGEKMRAGFSELIKKTFAKGLL